jgi:integrase
MPHSTTPAGQRKAAKPHKDFPLFQHKTGRWCKKVRGRHHYFGKIADDPNGEAALRLWLEQRDELLAGRTPRIKGDGLTTADLCNHFLAFKQSLLQSGEITQRTFDRYHANCAMLVSISGRSRLLSDLRPEDFQALRGHMAKRWGPVALGNEIQMVRSVFRYGYEAGLIDKPVRFGPGFRKPTVKTIRRAHAANGPRLFSPEEIHKALERSTTNMGAMILLGCNGALGPLDLAMLPMRAIDLKGGWLDYPRPKTGIARRIPLWPETVAAIQDVLTHRSEPRDARDTSLLFIHPRGYSYFNKQRAHRITNGFTYTLEKAGIKPKGDYKKRSPKKASNPKKDAPPSSLDRAESTSTKTFRTFYDLRRTFQTIAEGAHDLVAVQSIMGHAPASADMSAVYRQRVDDDRLRAVSDHVRAWLFGPASKGEEDDAAKTPEVGS